MNKTFLLTCIISLSSFMYDPPSILFYGDSITAGYGLEPQNAFPAQFEKILKGKGIQAEVINAGLSGETTAGGLSRINWILKKKVDIFVLELGANDGLRGLPLSETRSNLQKIINTVKVKYPDVTIVIAGMMVPPNMGDAYSTEFKKIFEDLALKNEALLIPFILDGVAGNPSLNQADGIHPNIEGHKIVAENIYGLLEKLL